MGIQLSDATVMVNNNVVAVEPNSVVFTEGFGEQNIRAASVGGGNVEQIYSKNVESSFAMVKFELPATVDAIELAREWKANLNQNLVQIVGSTPDGKTLSRTFSQAALINDYEVALGSDTSIPVEFKANKAI